MNEKMTPKEPSTDVVIAFFVFLACILISLYYDPLGLEVVFANLW